MAEPIGALRAELSASHAQFNADMGKARAAAQNHGKGIQAALNKVKGSFDDTMKSILGFQGALVALGAATGIAAAIKKSINAADELSKMAQKVGVSTESLSTLKYAADLADVSLESLGTGLKKLSKNAASAADGTGDAKDSFNALGIQLKTNEGLLKKSDELLIELADKFKGLPDGAEKTALAMNLFGKSGADLIPLLNEGAAGIKELQERARELGLELSTEAGRSAEEFNDRLTDLKASAEGFGRKIATDILPWLNEFVEVVRRAYDESGVLAAIWTALGGIGEKLYLPTLDQQIKALKAAIASPAVDPFTGYAEDTKALEEELAKLEAQKAAIEAADQKRFEDRRKREEEEAKLKDKNAKALRAKLEASKNQEEINKAIAKAQEGIIAKQGEQLEEVDKLNEKYFEDLKNDIQKFYEDTRTPLEKYEATVKRLNELYEQGMDADTYWRSIAKAREELEKVNEKTKDDFKELKQTIEGWGQDSAQAFVDFARTGKASFSDLVDSMINDLMKMIIYQNMMKPLFGAVSGIDWGNLGGLFGMSAPGSVSAKGNIFRNGNLIPFGRGGIVSRPTIFPMARGMGLMGEAGSEAVMPLTRLPGGDLGVRAAGAGGMIVNIYNNSGAEVKTKQKDTPQGPALDVIIDQAVANKLSQRGSYSNKSLRNTYGASERLTGR